MFILPSIIKGTTQLKSPMDVMSIERTGHKDTTDLITWKTQNM